MRIARDIESPLAQTILLDSRRAMVSFLHRSNVTSKFGVSFGEYWNALTSSFKSWMLAIRSGFDVKIWSHTFVTLRGRRASKEQARASERVYCSSIRQIFSPPSRGEFIYKSMRKRHIVD